MFANNYKGKRVLVTGHTGFKGSWLSTWLLELGANVAGYSVDLPGTPCNFEILGLNRRMQHGVGDVRDRAALRDALDGFSPEIIFHLAAQPLVRRAYSDPLNTFETNVVGTLNILEYARHNPAVRALVLITSDKCYRNVDWVWGYRENDTLGGEDPYSASKGCAELVSYAYTKSYFEPTAGATAIATARAGNVIGGGDWAEDRIVPDCIRSWSKGDTVSIRSPRSTRPWQHVLEPLSGYLYLGVELLRRNQQVTGQAYNFGPDITVNVPVLALIQELAKYWPEARWAIDQTNHLARPEARFLKLCCDKALVDLKWQPALEFPDTVRLVGEWYRQYFSNPGANMHEFTLKQIETYCRHASDRGLPWIQ